jgi:hypothetical protein
MSPESMLNHVLAFFNHMGIHDVGQALGYAAAIFTISTYSMRTMIPLRISGICANCLFIAYGYLVPAYPNLVLHAMLLPLNIFRLYQMLRLIAKVKEASNGDLSMDWLKPFTRSRACHKGEIIFAKGDIADTLFYPVSGRFLLIEIGVEIAPGEVVGEMGMVTPENRRTQTFQCTEDGELLALSYRQVGQLYFQNPKFGFFFLRLITKRLLANHRQTEDRLERLLKARSGAPPVHA